MKREKPELDLQNAFPPMPESCRAALTAAASSVKEDEPVKKYTFRTVLLAALLIIAMMVVAIAATTGGLVEWFRAEYGAALPQTAQELLSSTEKSDLEVGPVTVTVSEMLCDGKIAYLTAEAQLKEEGTAILYSSCCDAYDRIGEALAQKLNRADIDAKTSYLEAAKLTGLPLYSVTACMEVKDPNGDWTFGEEMRDSKTLDNGRLLLVDMLYLEKPCETEALPVNVLALVRRIDVDTLESSADERWEVSEERSLPVHGVIAEKTYAPQTDAQPLHDCFTLTGVTARQTSMGVYVYLHMQPIGEATFAALNIGYEWDVLDAEGNRFPTGASLTGELLDENGQSLYDQYETDETPLGAFQYLLMISADELPATMTVTDGTVQIPVA